MRAIGSSAPRLDARGKVTGETLYSGDLGMDGMLHACTLFANRPHARILSIDTAEALRVPGVVRIFLAADVPSNRFGLIHPDQPVLCGVGDDEHARIVRFVGDKVALVVAETQAAAEQARALIRVEYEDLPVVTDPAHARQPGAPVLHDDHPDNVLLHYRVRKGDAAAGFAQADVIVEGEYSTGAQEHAYLQPEAGLAWIDEEGRITVACAGQWAHEEREQIAHALKLPEEQVRVIQPPAGGAFGGREDVSIQIVLALAAMQLQRPVKLIWTREESIIGHHKRHPFRYRCRTGATRDGRIVAAEVELTSDCGAYASTSTKVLGNATLMAVGPYDIPHVSIDAYTVYTNNIPSGAFRGFGAPQSCFASECQMNKLAEALGMDPVALRLKNVLRDGSLLPTQSPMPPGVSLDVVVARCAAQAGWEQTDQGWRKPSVAPPSKPWQRRGLGLACAFKNVGFSFGAPERCFATVEIHGGGDIERVVVRCAGSDVGQGAHQAFRQIAAHALDVPLDRVEVVSGDTATTPGTSGSASASRMTFMAGNAIRGAAEKALALWRDEEDRPIVATYEYIPPPTTPLDSEGRSNPNFAYGYVAEAVEAEVDTETGEIRVRRVVCADDVGQAVNPQQVVGQIEGAVIQAQGWATIENFVQRDGQALTQYLSTYLIPTVLDIPDQVDSVIVEVPDPLGPFGARGMAEMPFIPLAPALTAALHDATGVWFDHLPLTPPRVLETLYGQNYDDFTTDFSLHSQGLAEGQPKGAPA